MCALLFALAAYGIDAKKQSRTRVKSANLSARLDHIPGWQAIHTLPLDSAVIKELALDDYIYQEYQKENHKVTLYIGYYDQRAKIGSAHDPLVCFPGQGWVLSERGQGRLHLPQGHEVIDFSTMTASRGAGKERILYWFQADTKAVATTLRQKIAAFTALAQGKGEESAFVRLTCTVAQNQDRCDAAMRDFTLSFYPVFQQYIKN